ncbi:DDE-type integrase/transposase/recombinase [Asticcacaulis tiandongensis]|uniref:DDE-type integrase/transposase/recombinase n=1 Tax=Asticcacaulis tiandongensis TaxID=2565365 RepID=UPI00112D8121|nr:DDE-type integrase/transposase/recombinase [Asticcacaulis tiandongensis]
MLKPLISKATNPLNDALTSVAVPKLRRGGLYVYDGVEVEYIKPLNGNLHFFIDPNTGRPLTGGVDGAVTTEWLTEMMAAGRFYCLFSLNRAVSIPCGESLEEIAERQPGALLLQKIVLKLDEHLEKIGRLSKGMRQTITVQVCHANPELVSKLNGMPSDRQVVKALKSHTAYGERSIRDFMSMRGRVPRKPKLSADLQEFIRQAVTWYVETKESNKIAAWGYFCLKIEEENRGRASQNTINLVKPCSKSTFYAHFDGFLDAAHLRKKYGSQHFNRNLKGVGKSGLVFAPGEAYQIDHTVADIFLIHPERKFVIGRPYITSIVDTASGAFLALVVGFTPPGRASVFQAIKAAFTPSADVYLGDAYPALKSIYGIPARIIADRGSEFISGSFTTALNDMGVEVSFARVRTPTDKPLVEVSFGTLNHKVIHRLKGVAFRDVSEKLGDYDSVKSATLDLPSFSDVLQKFISIHNLTAKERLEGAPPAMVWHEHILMHPMRAFCDLSELQRIAGISRMRSLSRKGVRVEHLHYGSGAEIDSILAEFRQVQGERGSFRVRVVSDPMDMGQIQVYCPHSKRFVTLKAKEFEYASGRSLFLHKITRKARKAHADDLYPQTNITARHAELIASANNPVKRRSQLRNKQAAKLAADIAAKDRSDNASTHVVATNFASEREDGALMPPGKTVRKRRSLSKAPIAASPHLPQAPAKDKPKGLVAGHDAFHELPNFSDF